MTHIPSPVVHESVQCLCSASVPFQSLLIAPEALERKASPIIVFISISTVCVHVLVPFFVLGILYTLSHFLFKNIFERGGKERGGMQGRGEKLSNVAKVRLRFRKLGKAWNQVYLISKSIPFSEHHSAFYGSRLLIFVI